MLSKVRIWFASYYPGVCCPIKISNQSLITGPNICKSLFDGNILGFHMFFFFEVWIWRKDPSCLVSYSSYRWSSTIFLINFIWYWRFDDLKVSHPAAFDERSVASLCLHVYSTILSLFFVTVILYLCIAMHVCLAVDRKWCVPPLPGLSLRPRSFFCMGRSYTFCFYSGHAHHAGSRA